MATERYQGWANYETWAVALWLNNEQSSQAKATAIASQACSEDDAAEAIERWIESMNPLADEGTLFSQLLQAALSEVDWYDVAAAFDDKRRVVAVEEE